MHFNDVAANIEFDELYYFVSHVLCQKDEKKQQSQCNKCLSKLLLCSPLRSI